MRAVGDHAWDAATVEQICYVHTREYVDSVKRFASRGGGYIEQDTFVSEKSYDVARQAVGAVCDAVDRVVGGDRQDRFLSDSSSRAPRHAESRDGFLSVQQYRCRCACRHAGTWY